MDALEYSDELMLGCLNKCNSVKYESKGEWREESHRRRREPISDAKKKARKIINWASSPYHSRWARASMPYGIRLVFVVESLDCMSLNEWWCEKYPQPTDCLQAKYLLLCSIFSTDLRPFIVFYPSFTWHGSSSVPSLMPVVQEQ